jgi:ArsR family transcriptional regulator, arsenate/arsenite/antimonite-responsive transcriptional repressor
MNKLSETFKALSDETRFKIINLLLSRDFCVRALASHLEVSEAAVSQHLKVLREAGLVKGEKRGYWVHYIVDRNMLKNTAEELKKMAEESRSQDNNSDSEIFKKKKTCCRKEGNKNV